MSSLEQDPRQVVSDGQNILNNPASDGSYWIESLDAEGRGITRRDGKVVFVDGALPSERVKINIYRKKPSFELAHTQEVVRASSQRVDPKCQHFGVCGGCAMQHLEPAAQVAIKQRVLEDGFLHLAKLNIPYMLPSIHGAYWGYRARARLSVRWVQKKGQVLVGFRERKSSFVADISSCQVLPKHVSDLLLPLRRLIESFQDPSQIPQIEVAVGEHKTILVLRHMQALSTHDLDQIRAFAVSHSVVWWLQPGGLDTLHPLDPTDADALYYTLPEFGLTMHYQPADFTQVNTGVNRVMISRALGLLDIEPHHRVADMFCGLGNFTLPLATRAKSVMGIEGSATLIARALDAAKQHGLEEKTEFSTLNLFDVNAAWLQALGYFDRMLIDPPREGAMALSQAIADLGAAGPERIVYVSCNPATLARDAGILVASGHYQLVSAGVINMFPHTAHVESMAVFARQ